VSGSEKNYSQASVIIVGAGPAGLAAAITLKKQKPELDICVLDKAAGPGNHNLSGAVLETASLCELLDSAQPDWRQSDQCKDVLSRRVEKDDVLFFPTAKMAVSMMPAIKMAKWLRLGFGQMIHHGDNIVSISKLTRWLAQIALDLGVEVLYGFAVDDIVMNANGTAAGVTLVPLGRDRQGRPQPNYVQPETLSADVIILAEGCDGLVTESFITKAGLHRHANPLFSVGVKEIIQVSPQQYQNFGDNRVVHAMGYPIWTPIIGPGMFGGGIMYSLGHNHIAVGMIVGADWKPCDFNPQDALVRFKQHAFVKPFIEGGVVVEAGAKMIPEGGLYAIPRDPLTNSIGKANVLIIGDSAGFVNMLKIKGLHNAIASGVYAGRAVVQSIANPDTAAAAYTQLLQENTVYTEMRSAGNFRQTVARFGNTLGFPISTLGGLLPRFDIERDYEAMTTDHYKYKTEKPFDKDGFIALAHVEHREEQPCHCEILDASICSTQCSSKFGQPCIIFCPAGVYELIQGEMKAANPSNCLHCKTCRNKCPYDNIRWHSPEGAGGPRYKEM